jgi:hypothetical protein
LLKQKVALNATISLGYFILKKTHFVSKSCPIGKKSPNLVTLSRTGPPDSNKAFNPQIPNKLARFPSDKYLFSDSKRSRLVRRAAHTRRTWPSVLSPSSPARAEASSNGSTTTTKTGSARASTTRGRCFFPELDFADFLILIRRYLKMNLLGGKRLSQGSGK